MPKKQHTSPSLEARWLGAELQVDQGILLEGTQHAAHGAAATAQREEPMGEILVIFSMGKWGPSKNLWGFMGTPLFFQRKPVQDAVDLICILEKVSILWDAF